MKSNLFRTLKLAALAFCGAAAFACTNLDDIEQRLDSLESDIQKLQTAVSSLNEAVKNLTTLAESGVISTIEKTDDGFVITTVSGDEITITNGAVGNTPLLSIEDGYWKVSYDNGESWEFMEDENGDKVPAAGMTPQFRVNEEGNWEVSYNGTQWTEVLDTEGNPVSAIGEGSNLFKDITYENGVLTIVFQDDNKLEIPVVPDFLCAIAGVDYATPVQFKHGEKKEFTVNIKGVANAIVTAPAGWKAELNGEEPSAILSVTAPEEDAASAMTKVSADTDSDISILAVSTKGNYTAITKMQVMVVQEVVPVPAISSIALKEATQESLTFTVTPNSDVTSWKYILLKATETAPADETAFAEADEKTGSTAQDVTIDGLAAGTSYKLYVLPVHTDTEAIYGDIKASEPASTEAPSYDTYFAMYEAGLNITIAGKEYTPSTLVSTFGEPTHITAETETPAIGATGVYFIDSDVNIEISSTPASGSEWNKVLVLGNDLNTRTKITLSGKGAIYAGGETGAFVCCNIEFVDNASGNYIFTHTYDNNGFDYMAFDNCRFIGQKGKSLISMSSSAGKVRYIKNLVMENCIFSSPNFNRQGGDGGNPVRIIGATGAALTDVTFESITFRNNIFYCSDGIVDDFQLFMTANGDANNVTTSRITIENNTFVNVTPTTSGLIQTRNLSTLTMQNNIFYIDDMHEKNYIVVRCYGSYPTGDICLNNIAYSPEVTQFIGFYGNRGWEGSEDLREISSDPFTTKDFTNAVFTPTGEYAGYGAQRN